MEIPGRPLPASVDRDASRQAIDDIRVSFADALDDVGPLRRQDEAVAKSAAPAGGSGNYRRRRVGKPSDLTNAMTQGSAGYDVAESVVRVVGEHAQQQHTIAQQALAITVKGCGRAAYRIEQRLLIEYVMIGLQGDDPSVRVASE